MDLDYSVQKTEVDGLARGPKVILREFMESGKDFAEVKNFRAQKTIYVRGALEQYITRHLLPVRVITRGGRVFLLKEDENDG